MRANRLYLLVITLLCNYTFAQEVDYVKDTEDNYLQIRQRPNTERLLSDYLEAINLNDDTIYAVLYAPADCYRCEAAIPAFYRLLKENNESNKMLLITANNDSVAARKYNTQSNYKADYYLYDTQAEYHKIFSFNSGDMCGVYLMKLSPKSGELLTGGQCTVLGRKYIKQLAAHSSRMKSHVFVEEEKRNEHTSYEINLPECKWKSRDIAVEINDKKAYISKVYDVPKIENEHFFFNDMLNNGIMLFKLDGDHFSYRSLIKANDDEKDQFVATSKENLDKLRSQGQVFYISLSANMIDDKQLYISYSLPKILENRINGELDFSLYNAPAILVRDIKDLSARKMITPDFDIEHSPYFHRHFLFDIFNGKLWLGCQKVTWPMDDFEKEDIEGNIELDSFDDRFYDTFNPTYASFDIESGKCISHYGHLEESNRLSKTGYYYINELYAHYGKDFLRCSGCTGKIYVADSTNIETKEREYNAFKIDIPSLPKPDSTLFYKIEYVNLYRKSFNRSVTAVKMNQKQICCLVRYATSDVDDVRHDRYSYVIINRRSGKSKEYPLPYNHDMNYLAYGIRNDHNHFSPFVFYFDGKYKIRVFSR